MEVTIPSSKSKPDKLSSPSLVSNKMPSRAGMDDFVDTARCTLVAASNNG